MDIHNIDASKMQRLYDDLKKFYCQKQSKLETKDLVSTHQYLPVPFDVAKQHLTPEDIFAVLEQIFGEQGVFQKGKFNYPDKHHNPIVRWGYTDGGWLNQEQAKIESLCLTGLCENTEETLQGNFLNLLVKLITSPGGNPKNQVPGTIFYLLPPYQRDLLFRSAYCPTSAAIDSSLADQKLQESLGWDAEQQLQVFILLANLAGHPVLIDLLPQVGRFSKTVFALPHCFRWMDISWLVEQLTQHLQGITQHFPDHSFVVQVWHDDILGLSTDIDTTGKNQEANIKIALRKIYHSLVSEILLEEKKKPGAEEGVSLAKITQTLEQKVTQLSVEEIYQQYHLSSELAPQQLGIWLAQLLEVDSELQKVRQHLTDMMLSAESQQQIQQNVISKILQVTESEELPTEETLSQEHHEALVSLFKKQGLWPVAGGCWNSAGHPIFKRMNPAPNWQDTYSYPITDHVNHSGNLVNAFAGDMDIVAPWYFAFLDKAQQQNNLYDDVIDEYIRYCEKIYQRLAPNGFRIDHIDHCADYPVSINNLGNAISYRAPLEVFRRLSQAITQKYDSTFTLFAEYMGWGDSRQPHLYGAYNACNINTAISTDIVGEYRNNARVMIDEGNTRLADYNNQSPSLPLFSVTKIHDNHDRSHPDIICLLSDFTAERALLKWIKCIFLPGGPQAPRPALLIDGNETFTENKSFVDTFLDYKPLKRNNNYNFFAAFSSLWRYSLQNPVLKYGTATLLHANEAVNWQPNNNEVSCWIVTAPESKQGFLVVANEWLDDKTELLHKNPKVSLKIPTPFHIKAQLQIPQEFSGDTLKDWLKNIPEVEEKPLEDSKDYEISKDNPQTIIFPELPANKFFIFVLEAQING